MKPRSMARERVGSPSRSGPFNGNGDFENEAKERPPVTRQERHAEETVGH